MNRIDIAEELMRGCPEDRWEETQKIADMLRSGLMWSDEDILNAVDLDSIPMTHDWLTMKFAEMVEESRRRAEAERVADKQEIDELIAHLDRTEGVTE